MAVNLKRRIQGLLEDAIEAVRGRGELTIESNAAISIERARDSGHGDFASPVALGLARTLRRNPREVAEAIAARIPTSEDVAKIEIAGPGFINFFLTPLALQSVATDVLEAGNSFGRSEIGGGAPVQVEFVSANPTGPLHVGHGRHAAFGAVIANLLEATGHRVQREYYINDAGRQMDILGTSVWLRYLERCGESIPFPVNGYRGGYVIELAAALGEESGEAFRVPASAVLAGIPPDEADGGSREAHIDALIARTKSLLGDRYRQVFDHALGAMTSQIREDLERFGVTFDRWYSERSLVESGAVERVVEQLRGAKCAYLRDGALWFASTEFGDEKDRVLIRENGQATYFTNDIAYHLDKVERGFEELVDVWGADHHGYIRRMKAALAALGRDPDRLEVLLVQFAILYRGGKKIPMSTRAGEFVTLRELCEEVGTDAARFFYVMRKNDQHLDFDLDLAVSRSAENPVYYVQYAHARVCSVMRQLSERGHRWEAGRVSLHRLVESQELGLLRTLSRYPEVVETAGMAREPHQMAYYLRELANDFHAYYNAHTLLTEDAELRDARVALALATRQVLSNGLELLGVSAPESM